VSEKKEKRRGQAETAVGRKTAREMCVIPIWNPTVKIGAREDHNGIKVRSEGLRTTHGYVG
jgi:hypothetical protein